MKFSDIPGYTIEKQKLIQAVKSNHVAHAQLFASPEGGASLALAIAFAQYINCLEPTDHDSCGACSSCRKYERYIHPDLHFVLPVAGTKGITGKNVVTASFIKDWRRFIVDNPFPQLNEWAAHFGAENKQCSISKEESRQVNQLLSLRAFEAKYKVVIFWLPELLHPVAANALLKVIEEPSDKTLFILASSNIEKVLPTIYSRTQLLRLKALADEDIQSYLVETKEIEVSNASHLAYLAEGDIHEAIRLTGDLDHDGRTTFQEWMRNCFKMDFEQLALEGELFAKLPKEAQKSLFKYGLGVFRESMLCLAGGEALLRVEEEEKNFIANFSKVLSLSKVDLMTQYFDTALYHLERNANVKLLHTDLSLKIGKVFRA